MAKLTNLWKGVAVINTSVCSCAAMQLRGLATIPRYNYGLSGKGKDFKEKRGQTKFLPKQYLPKGEVLFGIHPILLALKARKRQYFHSVFVKAAREKEDASTEERDGGRGEVKEDAEQGESGGQLQEIQRLATEAGIPIHHLHPAALDVLSGSRPHQGVCLDASRLRIPRLNVNAHKIQGVWTQEKPPLWLLLHALQDPMNLGAILRTANFLGVDQVVLPNTHSCRVTPVVSKASAGAVEVMDLVSLSPQPGSLQALIEWWRQGRGQVLGTAGLETGRTAVSVTQVQVHTPTLLIMGNEGSGLTDEVLGQCDSVITIPSSSPLGAVQSLNVSVATGIILSHLLSR